MEKNDAVASFYGAATNASDDEWYLCDDSSVRRVNRADVFDEQAYVLFYERGDEEVPPPHAAAPLSLWGPQSARTPEDGSHPVAPGRRRRRRRRRRTTTTTTSVATTTTPTTRMRIRFTRATRSGRRDRRAGTPPRGKYRPDRTSALDVRCSGKAKGTPGTGPMPMPMTPTTPTTTGTTGTTPRRPRGRPLTDDRPAVDDGVDDGGERGRGRGREGDGRRVRRVRGGGAAQLAAAPLAAAQLAAPADGRWRGGSADGRTARRAGDDHEHTYAWMILFSRILIGLNMGHSARPRISHQLSSQEADVEIPPFAFGIAMESLISLTENPVGSEA